MHSVDSPERSDDSSDHLTREELARARAEAQANADRLRAVIDSSPAAFYVKDELGRYVDVNAEFLRLAGRAREELIGIDDEALFGEAIAREFAAQDDQVRREGAPLRIEHTVIYKGQELHFMTVKFPVRGAAGERLVGGLSTEVTAERALRRELAAKQVALAQSEARFRGVQEVTSDGFQLLRIVRGDDGQAVDFEWIYQNAAATRKNGLRPEDIVGKRVLETIPQFRNDLLYEHLIRLSGHRESISVEREYRGPDGAGWYRVVGLRIGEDIALTFVDLTAQKRDQERRAVLSDATAEMTTLTDSEAMLARMADRIAPALADWCAIDLFSEGSIPRRVAVSHRDPEKAAWSRRFWEEAPPERDGRDLHERLRDERGSTGIVIVTDEHLDEHNARTLREAGVRAFIIAPIRGRDRVFGMISLAMAESERSFEPADEAFVEELGRRAAVALESARLYEVARAERARAEEANRLKDDFLAIMSHELRTPLHAIAGWTRMLRLGGLSPEEQEHALAVIQRNADAQTRLVADLLDVSRIVAGKLQIEVGEVDLARVVDAAVESVRHQAQAKRIEIEIALEPDMGLVAGDAARLQQVVWNLLSNALKFSPEGGRVRARLFRDGETACIEVRDWGQGISSDFVPFVFDRFRQADAGFARAHGGLGLGLAIAKHLVELHEGTIAVASEGRGKGTLFTVALPLAGRRGAGRRGGGVDGAGERDAEPAPGGDGSLTA